MTQTTGTERRDDPGKRLLSWAGCWFDATMERVFVPLVADWQHEWASKRGARRRVNLRWLAHRPLAPAR